MQVPKVRSPSSKPASESSQKVERADVDATFLASRVLAFVLAHDHASSFPADSTSALLLSSTFEWTRYEKWDVPSLTLLVRRSVDHQSRDLCAWLRDPDRRGGTTSRSLLHPSHANRSSPTTGPPSFQLASRGQIVYNGEPSEMDKGPALSMAVCLAGSACASHRSGS